MNLHSPAVFSPLKKWSSLLGFALSLLFLIPAYPQYKFDNRCHVAVQDDTPMQDYQWGSEGRAARVRQVERDFKQRAKEDLEIDLLPGMLDTGVLQKSYIESGARDKYDFATFRDLEDVFPTQLIKQSKVAAFLRRGLSASEIYGQDTLLEHKVLRNFSDRIPNHQFYLSHENVALLHRLYGKEIKQGWSVLGKTFEFIGLTRISDYFWKGGGNYRITRTRYWDSNVTPQKIGNLISRFEKLSEPGMPFANVKYLDKQTQEDFLIKTEHPYAFGSVMRYFMPGKKKLPNGNYDIVFSYPSAKIVRMGMDMIMEWANQQMRWVEEGREHAMDPIEIAATVQEAMVYLHPFKDGNGRITKMLRDKILEKFNLPFHLPYGDSLGRDLERTHEEFVAEVRFGVFYALNRLAEIDTKYSKGYHSNVSPTVIDTKVGVNLGGFDTRKLSKQERKLISDKAMPERPEQVLDVGGGGAYQRGRFNAADYTGEASFGRSREIRILNRGGFLQGTKGLPWVYVASENALYPIADWSVPLYGKGGSLFRKNTGKNIYNFRRPNPAFQEMIDANLDFFRRVKIYEKNPSDLRGIDPKRVIIKPYEYLEKGQRAGSHFGTIQTYDWQRNILDATFEGRLDPEQYPIATLAKYRGNQKHPGQSGPTTLQKLFNTNKPEKIKFNHIMSGYSLERQFLIKFEMDVKLMPEEIQEMVLPKIAQAREDIYLAARKELAGFTELWKEIFEKKPGKSNHPLLSGSEANVEFHKQAREHELYKGLYKYAKYQEWFYPSYKKGISEVPQDSVAVIRNMAEGFHEKLLGLATEAQQGSILKIIPFLPSLFRALDAEIKAANKEGRQLNAKNLNSWIERWVLNNKVNDYEAVKNEHGEIEMVAKKDGNETRRKNTRAFIDKIVNGVLVDYYATRGMDAEFRRPFIDLYLHTVGYHPQTMKSTSVDPIYEWKLNGRDELRFFGGGISTMYLSKINKEGAVALFSNYRDQAEYAEDKWLHPVLLHIYGRQKFRVSEDQLRLTQVDEKGKPMRDNDGDLIYTDFGKKTLDIFDTIVKYDENHLMVPPTTPIYNSRYQLVNEEGKRIDSQGNVIGR